MKFTVFLESTNIRNKI